MHEQVMVVQEDRRRHHHRRRLGRNKSLDHLK
jgi:hypothetical protein